ncbi:fimbrial protein YehD [Pseudenterobacter timonensis]|uniref:Fimbrial protein YehD n=1 Tax=Pseudenterobacter timonensis TaxID=1755099 RepID=A0AAE4IUB0_9ENTR|nr:fimbrial protein YehD [Pseudenterobacter timonensis]MDR9889152.1 fimbrial protein YehD [Pseudenterobacter timonensis]
MKRSLVTAAVLSALFVSAGAFAADSDYNTDYGVLNIKGEVKGTTCKFRNNNAESTITMKEVGTDVLSNVSAGTAYKGYTNRTTTPLKLQCEAGKTPRIYFSPSQFEDANESRTLNTASSNGVGFLVMYENEPFNPEDGIELTPNDNGIYELNFTAQYARLKSASAVSSGEVASSLTLTVVTD